MGGAQQTHVVSSGKYAANTLLLAQQLNLPRAQPAAPVPCASTMHIAQSTTA
jgi:hypothetical protein